MTDRATLLAPAAFKGVARVAVGRSDGGEAIRRPDQLDDRAVVGETFLHRPAELLVPADLAQRVRAQLPSLSGRWALQPRDPGHLLLRLEGAPDDPDLLPASAAVVEAARRLRGELRSDPRIAVNAIFCSAALNFSSAPKYQGKAAFPQPVSPPALERRPRLAAQGQRAVVCGIVDTGIAPHTDPWLEAAIAGRQVVLGPGDERDAPDVMEPHGELDPVAGHGTFITGQVLWGAPAASVYTVRHGGEAGVVDEDALVHAIDALVTLAGGHLDLLNLSLGGWSETDREPPHLAARLRRLTYDGTLVIAAAGNLASSRPFWPAAMPEVVAVAAVTTTETLAPWSNCGGWVNVATRGEQIESTFFDAYSTRDPSSEAPKRLDFRGWGRWTGSSFSVPRVVAAVARRLAEQPELTPRNALQAIEREQRARASTRIAEIPHAWLLA